MFTGPRKALTLAAMVAAGAIAIAPATALAGTANKGLPGASASDPIANVTWGHYTGTLDKVYPTYQAAKGSKKRLLGEVAMRPEAYWFGSWNPKPSGAASGYIEDVTHGDANVMASLSDFDLAPWESHACGVVPSSAEVSAYKSWQSSFAAGVGRSRALVVLQPDFPVVDNPCIGSGAKAKYRQMVAFAAKKLNAQPLTTVYIDAGSSDWLSVSAVATLLAKSGVKSVRGFALDATHFDSTDHEIAYGQKVVKALASRGIKNKHFIIDTAENGHPFTHQAYTKSGGKGSQWASRPACVPHKESRFCQTFGIPPTWQVGLSQWKLGKTKSTTAKKLVDGYVWFGRPWMKGQSAPFDPSLTEEMARSTPFPYPKFAEPKASATAVMHAQTATGSSRGLAWSTNL